MKTSNRLIKFFIILFVNFFVIIHILIIQFSQKILLSHEDHSIESLYSTNGLFSDSIRLYRYERLIEKNKDLETKIVCVGSMNNQSCLIRNLYFYRRDFWIFTTGKNSYRFLNVRIGAWISSKLIVNQRRFYSLNDLEIFIKNEINPIVFPDSTVYFDQPWLTNIGHALFDGLYPAFVALIRFPPRHLQPFRILLSNSDRIPYSQFVKDVYQRFSGLGMINSTILDKISDKQWVAFEDIVIGSGDLCQRCLQSNFQLPGGIQLNASILFRNRMFKQYGFNSSSSLKSTNDSQQRILNGYIIDNKRYSNKDRQEIHLAIEHINQYTQLKLLQYQHNLTLLESPLLRLNYVYYPLISLHENGSLQLNHFQNHSNGMFSHLLLIDQTDIHITGPGTGQFYQTFLRPGSVHINLGGISYVNPNDTNTNYTSFLEQYLTSGTPYIKAIYYPINQRTRGIEKHLLIHLIKQAARIVLQGFSIPVNPEQNLAPDGRLFIEMCQLDELFCETVTRRWINDDDYCTDTWPEDIIHGKGPWSIQGIQLDNGSFLHCHVNRTLIEQLKIKYQIN